MDTLRCDKSSYLMRVIPFKLIPSEMSNGGFLSSNALCNIRGVFASLSGGLASSSPYWDWSVSAVNRAIVDTMSWYNDNNVLNTMC